MQHTTPSENPNTPKELLSHIEGVRNRISVHESEVKRLQSLTASLQYSIDQQVVQKKDLDENIDRLTREKGQLEKEIIALAQNKEDILKEKESIEADIQKAVKAFGIQTGVMNKRDNELDQREKTIASGEASYAKKLEELNRKEALHDARVAKLTEALQ